MQNHLVSIVIPFKNTEKFLPDCLNSILKQTYPNFEVLAVNDSSIDSSKEIVADYSLNDSRIKVFENSGKGIINALKMAYSKSKGTFITRMDSDDIMTPNKLEVMVNSLLKNGEKHIAVGQVTYFSKAGINNGYFNYQQWLNSLIKTGANYSEIYKECVIPSPCWMVYKTDFDLCGGFNSERYPEDYDLAFRFYEHDLKCIPCSEVLHLWRDYPERTSRTSVHYAENYFLDLKFDYFLKLDYKKSNNLVVWSAGKKGKTIAKKLLKKDINFIWVCNNSNKIGKHIYGKKMYSYTHIETINNAQIVITVANQKEQKFISKYLNILHKKPFQDYFFFC
tara:strand:+ start:170545 stop:171552 length:1008 start_codon:yes stop_codon:yes gene_type:complete